MNPTAKPFLVFVLLIIVFGCGTAFALTPAQTLNLPDADDTVIDDEIPDVTARVARISFIRGDVQIRRSGGQDWEKATLNLPILEGDEIATSDDARVEVQFGAYSHLRLAEKAYLKVETLKDAGVAVSLSQGTMNLRLTEFDKDNTFFEIDAPKTTIAVQKAGQYRVDAGKQGDTDIRISASEDGEARVYSDTAGFTVKSGRSAKIFIDGATAGEWETADAGRFVDEFDKWALDRDAVIAQHLKNAYYNKYYDQDIYGAEDLSDSGEWIFTAKYGYVWRPYASAIGGYADWSPYRYGHWRWVPPYGWTWINDEPWGWATYHHGRWLYDDGYWAWSPYGYYRPARSWWSPALVVLSIVSDNICWYPLGYHHHYYNYNANYHHTPGWNGGHHNNDGPVKGGIKPPPSPTGQQPDLSGKKPRTGPFNAAVPPKGVVAIPSSEFGVGIRHGMTAPPAIAQTVLTSDPRDAKQPPVLPGYDRQKAAREIRSDKPQIAAAVAPVRTGVTARKPDAPVDPELRKARMFGNREPVTTREPVNTGGQGGSKPAGETPADRRKTGAVDRQTVIKTDRAEDNRKEVPASTPPTRSAPPSDPGESRRPRTDPPAVTPPRSDPSPSRQQEQRRESPPASKPAETKSAPPPVKTESKPAEKTDAPKKKDGR